MGTTLQKSENSSKKLPLKQKRKSSTQDSTLELKDMAVKFCDDLKAQDIKVHDFRSKYYECEFMITCSGMSTTHVMSISERVETELKKNGIRPMSIEGREEKTWVLLDYGAVVVHIMELDKRRILDLDALFEERLAKIEEKRKSSLLNDA